MASVLGQPLPARRGKRVGSRQLLYFAGGSPPPAALRQRLGPSPVPGLLFLVIALIAYGSLYPWHFNFHKNVQPLWLLIHNWPQQLNRWLVFDIVLNVLLYVPLGVLAFLTFARRRRSAGFPLISAAALGFAVSVTMELLQAYDLQRDTGPLDVVTNTTGSAIGAVLALLCQPLLEKLADRKTRRSAVAAAALAIVWLGYQLYPFFPVFRLHRLRAESALLAHFPPLNGVEIWTGAAEWFAIWLVLDTLGESIHGLWLGAMLVLPLQIFIAGRALTWTDLLSAAL